MHRAVRLPPRRSEGRLEGTLVIHVEVSATIRASPVKVAEMFREYQAWPRLFSASIRGVRLVGEEHGIEVLEIDHVEGTVINTLRVVSSGLIELEDDNSQFAGHFANRFEPVRGGTRYTVVADITWKGPYKVLGPLLRPYVRRQITHFVINPMKLAAER
jgi:Polyketide cyclase / dehydrase and lipid transport